MVLGNRKIGLKLRFQWLYFLSCWWTLTCFLLVRGEKEETLKSENFVQFCASPVEQVLYAFSQNDIKKVDQLVENEEFKVEMNDPQNALGGETLLTHLISTKKKRLTSLKEVAYLIQKGVDPTITNIDGTTPLLASLEKEDLLVSYFVLEYIANRTDSDSLSITVYDISRANDAGQTALCTALERDLFDIVDLLLDLGVTTRCYLKFDWCCNPLKIAVNVLDAQRMLKLVNLDKYSKFFMNDALQTALNSGREDIIHVLLKHFGKEMLRKRSTGVLPQDAKNRLSSLSRAMEIGQSSVLVDALLEVEMEWENPFLCGWVNQEGRTIFFTALYYGYKNCIKRLMKFYDSAALTKITGYVHCYADRADANKQCPSSVLLYSTKWLDVKENAEILKFLFSRRNPLTGENCLSNALRQKESVMTVFRDVGEKAARVYGSQILDLAGLNIAGKDVLLQALDSRAPQPVIILTMQWLLQGYDKGVTSYLESFKQGVLVALGGTGNLNDQFSERDTYFNAIEAAAKIAPGYLYELILIVPLWKPNSDVQYDHLMKFFLGPFPLTKRSFLSHYIKGSLTSLRLWNRRSTLKKFLQKHNGNFGSGEHLTDALDTIAEAHVIKCELNPIVGLVFWRQKVSLNFLLKKLAFKLRVSLKSPFYTILIDDHIINIEGVKRERYLRFDAVFEKRKNVLVELLRSPQAMPNVTLRHLSGILFILTLFYGLIILSLHGFIVFKANEEPHVIQVSPFIDIIPCAKSYWCTAFLEGLRRSFCIPRKIGCHTIRIRSSAVKCAVYILSSLNWVPAVAFVWSFIEIWILAQDTNCHTINKTVEFEELMMKRTSALRYLFPCTLLLHTILAKMCSKEHTVWFCWFLFGPKACNSCFEDEDDAVRHFDWLPQTKRQWLLFLQEAQRLNVRDRLRSMSLRYEKRFVKFREHVKQNTQSRGLFQKLGQAYRNVSTCPNSRLDKHLSKWDEISCQGNEKLCQKNLRSTTGYVLNVGRESIYTQKKNIHLGDFLLSKCIANIQKKHKMGYLRDMLLMYTSCFVVAQFPFWRCFVNPFKMLYFDIYFSQAKYQAYMTSNTLVLLLRELCMFVVLWQELIQLSCPILQSIRLAKICRIAFKTLRKYPLSCHHCLIPVFGESCHHVAKTKPTSLKTKKIVSKAILSSIENYVEIRQSLLKQFAYIWEPIETALNVFCFYWGFVLLKNYTHLYKGMLLKNYFSTLSSSVGLQLALMFVWVAWIAIQALRTNLELNRGWSTLQQTNLQPYNVTSYRKGKHALFQAVSFFKQHEFRLTLASMRITTTFAACFVFFYTVVFIEFCLIVPEIT